MTQRPGTAISPRMFRGQPSGRGHARWHGTGRGEVGAMLVNRMIRSTGAPITKSNSLRISSFIRLARA